MKDNQKLQISQLIPPKWQFVFWNVSEEVLVSLKCIINILTVPITRMYSFRPVRSNLS